MLLPAATETSKRCLVDSLLTEGISNLRTCLRDQLRIKAERKVLPVPPATSASECHGMSKRFSGMGCCCDKLLLHIPTTGYPLSC